MATLIVSGLINIETTVRIDGFPLAYCPVLYPFGGVYSGVSGVGMNLALAFKSLGDEVRFLSMIGGDPAGDGVMAALAAAGIDASRVVRALPETPHSAILYDPDGRRQIHVDLKDIQERRYPAVAFEAAAGGADAACLCNINFNRELLPLARARGLPVFCDVHVLRDPRDAYNADFMAAAELIFMSDEGLWAPPEEAARELLGLYPARAVVVGLGAKGALFVERGRPALTAPALRPRPIISTIGAGDALFSSFCHYYIRGRAPEEALSLATAFAGWKIGEAGAARGFLSEHELETLVRRAHKGDL